VPAAEVNLLHDSGGVGDGSGVRQRMNGGEPAPRCGARAGLDRLGVLAAGLAQVGMQVYEAGQGNQAFSVDHNGTRRGVDVTIGDNLVDLAAIDDEMGLLLS